MKILIVGAGLTGCSFARLLKDRSHDVIIKEKLNHIGGLSYTKKSPNGFLYEPYGARIFHTKDEKIKNFVERFAKFNSYIHKKIMIINGIPVRFPPSLETIEKFPEKNQILKELKQRPKKTNKKNFETLMISLVGPTLYNFFIYNYSKKMWGIEPKDLEPAWIPKTLTIREKDQDCDIFKGEWQGIPIGGYTKFFEKMTYNIPIEYDSKEFNNSEFDVVIFTGQINKILNFKYGKLPYRSMRFHHKKNRPWENETYGTINLPQHPKFIRKANFKVLYQKKSKQNWVQYQEPIAQTKNNLPMYPINTKKNNKIFDKYLKQVCKIKNIIPTGRLGLYKYLTMNKTISLVMDMIPLIEEWENLKPNKRHKRLKQILNNY